MNFLKKAWNTVKSFFTPAAVGGGSLVLASASHAAIDTTAALAGVTEAQTALLTLLGGFIGLSAAIYGVVKVYGFLKRKAGA